MPDAIDDGVLNGSLTAAVKLGDELTQALTGLCNSLGSLSGDAAVAINGMSDGMANTVGWLYSGAHVAVDGSHDGDNGVRNTLKRVKPVKLPEPVPKIRRAIDLEMGKEQKEQSEP